MPALSAYPNSCSVFSSDPAGLAAFSAFVLNNTGIPVPNRVRLDTMGQTAINRKVTPARSPIETLTVDSIRRDPVSVVVRGTLSATPLGPVETPLGALGGQIRIDILRLRQLEGIQDRGEPVILVTPIDTFPSMAMSIESSTVGTNKIDLVLSFEEVRIITATLIAGTLGEGAEVGAQSTTQAGGQSPQPASAPPGVAGGLG